ncbi:MAG: AtpZ/AtpI family protein [Chloroflexi bacterium]|nr:AtpZ/AtpI family protein [Chloroflexota bacterium]
MNRGRLVWTLMGLGWYIGLSIVLPLLAGWWLDGKAGTMPWFTLLGLALGLVLAFTGAYRVIRTMEQERNGKKEKD